MLYFAFATQTTGMERFRLPVLGIQALLVASLFAPRWPRQKKQKVPKRRWYERGEDEAEESEVDGANVESDDAEPDSVEPEPEALARPI